MIGSRVIKTCLAVAFAILIARALHLQSPQFAGIVAVLSVQPTLYRSFRHGLQQTISALIGAGFAAIALYLFGNSFVVIGIVTLILMTLHVRIKWTNTLQLSVVIAINTLGAVSQFFGASALNQILLVLVGTGTGAFINMFRRAPHKERAHVLLATSEGMIRALLYYLYLDLLENRITPYRVFREQLNEVRTFIEEGKEISRLILEDRRFLGSLPNILIDFQWLESLVERVRDLSKELQDAPPGHPDLAFFERALLLTTRMQERKLNGQRTHFRMLRQILARKKSDIWREADRTETGLAKLPFFNLCGHLDEYLRIVHAHDPSVDLSEEATADGNDKLEGGTRKRLKDVRKIASGWRL
jgi:hypothetical protein